MKDIPHSDKKPSWRECLLMAVGHRSTGVIRDD